MEVDSECRDLLREPEKIYSGVEERWFELGLKVDRAATRESGECGSWECQGDTYVSYILAKPVM